MMVDFEPIGGPTSITPNLTFKVSLSCKFFSMKAEVGEILRVSHFLSRYAVNSYWSLLGIFTPGNKSSMIPLKRGISWAKNLGTLESCMALMRIISSATSGSALFRPPAITNTLFTALIPKS